MKPMQAASKSIYASLIAILLLSSLLGCKPAPPPADARQAAAPAGATGSPAPGGPTGATGEADEVTVVAGPIETPNPAGVLCYNEGCIVSNMITTLRFDPGKNHLPPL